MSVRMSSGWTAAALASGSKSGLEPSTSASLRQSSGSPPARTVCSRAGRSLRASRTCSGEAGAGTGGRAASIARRAAVELSIPRVLPHVEALAGQSPDVVGEPDDEDEQHQRDPDCARALHDAEGDPPAAQLLGDRPEDVAAVQRQEREEV